MNQGAIEGEIDDGATVGSGSERAMDQAAIEGAIEMDQRALQGAKYQRTIDGSASKRRIREQSMDQDAIVSKRLINHSHLNMIDCG